MPLTVSRTIEITPQIKVGRNDPCPCGSGKKYKKCHLLREGNYSPAVKSNLTTKVSDWLLKQPQFENLLKTEVKKIFGDSVTTIEEITPAMEALIFEGKMGKVSPLDYFLLHADLTASEKEYYQSWKTQSVFSFFKVLSVQLGQSVEVQDLITQKTFLVREKLATYQLQNGDLLATRVIPFGEDYAFSGAMPLSLPKELDYNMERNRFSLLPGRLSQLEAVRAIYSPRGKTPEKIKQDLSGKLAACQAGVTLKEVEKVIETGDKDAIFPLVGKINRNVTNRRHAEEILDLITKLGNLHAQSKLKPERQPGPMEQTLTGQFMRKISKKDFGSMRQEERDKTIKQEAQKWFTQAQKELQGKTPEEAILSERESLGNSHRELSYEFSLAPLTSFNTGFEPNEYNFAVKAMQEGKFREALDGFAKTKPEMTENADSFRWYNNVGSCLANLGEVLLARKYFEKSFALNPNYEVAAKNLRTFSDEQLTKRLTAAGQTYLFNCLAEIDFSPDSALPENSNWLPDLLTFLSYVTSHHPQISPKWELITFRQVLEINRQLLNSDPENLTFKGQNGEIETNYSAEWQFPKVRFLHEIGLLTNLVRKKGHRLVITHKGQDFSQKQPAQQFGFLIYYWLQKVNWASLHSGGWQPNVFEQATEAVQANSYMLIKSLSDRFAEKDFTAQDLVKAGFPDIREIPNIHVNKEDQELFEMTTSLAVEKAFLFYLLWAGLLEPKNKLLFGNRYRVTSFGKKFLDQIASHLHSMIPTSLFKIQPI